MRNAPWVLVLALLGYLVFAQWSIGQARVVAEAEAARGDSLALVADSVEAARDTLRSTYDAQADSLKALHSLITSSMDAADSAQARARRTARALRSRVEAAAGDSARVVALVDSISVAHDAEVHALRSQVSTLAVENAALWRRTEAADSLLAAGIRAESALKAQVESLTIQAQAWERVAKPPFLLNATRKVVPALVGAGVAFALIR